MIFYLIIVLVLLYLFTLQKETYINSEYKLQKLPYKTKDDVYMNFLGNVNDSFREYLKEISKDSNSPIRQKALCDDRIRKEIQSKALIDAFKQIQEKDIDKDSTLFDTNVPKMFNLSSDRSCGNKASQLCEKTEPMLYMSQNTSFPPRWIFKPYKDISLPKHTDLKCWSNMLNCCKTNF